MQTQVKLPKIYCPKGGLHQNEVINQICLDSNCVHRGNFLLCIACSDREHQDHETIPAKLLLNEIVISLDKSPENLYKKFEQQKTRAMTSIQNLRKNFETKISTVENAVNNLYAEIQKNFVKESFQFASQDVTEFLSLLTNSRGIDEIKEALKELLFRISVESNSNTGQQNVELMNKAKRSTILFDLSCKQEELYKILDGIQKDLNRAFANKEAWINKLGETSASQPHDNSSYLQGKSGNSFYSSNQFEKQRQEQQQNKKKSSVLSYSQMSSDGFKRFQQSQVEDELTQNQKAYPLADQTFSPYSNCNNDNGNNISHSFSQKSIGNQSLASQSLKKHFDLENYQKSDCIRRSDGFEQEQIRLQNLPQSYDKLKIHFEKINDAPLSVHSQSHTQQQFPFQQSQNDFYQTNYSEASPINSLPPPSCASRNFYNPQQEFNYSQNSVNMQNAAQQSMRSTSSSHKPLSQYIDLYKTQEDFQQFQISEDFKHEDIKIKRNTIINNRYGEKEQIYRVQLLTPTLELSLPKIQTWSFQIINCLPAWIGFGMAHINHMKEKKFQLNRQDFNLQTAENNNGLYIVTSNGFAFKHNQRTERINFCLTKGDTVTMRFDPFMNLLIFYKNGDFSFPYNLQFQQELGNKLYPCVVFWYPNDEILLL